MSEKLFVFSARQYFNRKDCKFPQYRWEKTVQHLYLLLLNIVNVHLWAHYVFLFVYISMRGDALCWRCFKENRSNRRASLFILF